MTDYAARIVCCIRPAVRSVDRDEISGVQLKV